MKYALIFLVGIAVGWTTHDRCPALFDRLETAMNAAIKAY